MGIQHIKYKLATVLNISKIITILYLELTPDYAYEGESHDFWEMVYVDKGSIIASTKKDTYLLNGGDVIFHKPNEFHSLKSANGEAPNVFIITFDCTSPAIKYFKGLHTHLPTELRLLIREIIKERDATFNEPFLDPILHKPTLIDQPILGGQQLIRNYLQILLIHMMRSDNDNRIFTNKGILYDHLSQEIINYLENRIYSNINIDNVCARFNYSKTYLCTAFKQSTGLSIMQYYNQIQIEEAKRLLRVADMSITEISEKLCFCNPHYFSHVFQKYMHMSPSEYRKSIKPN